MGGLLINLALLIELIWLDVDEVGLLEYCSDWSYGGGGGFRVAFETLLLE